MALATRAGAPKGAGIPAQERVSTNRQGVIATMVSGPDSGVTLPAKGFSVVPARRILLSRRATN